jgi:hypothetical protein
MEGKSGDSRSRPIEQETQLALYWSVKSPFYATEYKDYQTRIHTTSLQSVTHAHSKARGNPHNNMGNPHQTIALKQMSREEGNTGPASHLTPTCLP